MSSKVWFYIKIDFDTSDDSSGTICMCPAALFTCSPLYSFVSSSSSLVEYALSSLHRYDRNLKCLSFIFFALVLVTVSYLHFCIGSHSVSSTRDIRKQNGRISLSTTQSCHVGSRDKLRVLHVWRGHGIYFFIYYYLPSISRHVVHYNKNNIKTQK